MLKACPQCKSPAPLDADRCQECGHVFRTRFDADGHLREPSRPPAPTGHSIAPTQRTVVAQRLGALLVVLGALALGARVVPLVARSVRQGYVAASVMAVDGAYTAVWEQKGLTIYRHHWDEVPGNPIAVLPQIRYQPISITLDKWEILHLYYRDDDGKVSHLYSQDGRDWKPITKPVRPQQPVAR